MKKSSVLIMLWLFTGIGLAVVDWKFTVVWVVSTLLGELADKQKKKEKGKKRKTPTYIN